MHRQVWRNLCDLDQIARAAVGLNRRSEPEVNMSNPPNSRKAGAREPAIAKLNSIESGEQAQGPHPDSGGTNQGAQLAFSIATFCRATSLSRSQVYHLIREGILPARKCGGRTLVSVRDATEFVNSLPRVPGSDRTTPPASEDQ